MNITDFFPLYVLMGLLVLVTYYCFSVRSVLLAFSSTSEESTEKRLNKVWVTNFIIAFLLFCMGSTLPYLLSETYSCYFVTVGLVPLLGSALFSLLRWLRFKWTTIIEAVVIVILWISIWLYAFLAFYMKANQTFYRKEMTVVMPVTDSQISHSSRTTTYHLYFQPVSFNETQVESYRQPMLPIVTRLTVDALPYLSGMKWLPKENVDSDNILVSEEAFNKAHKTPYQLKLKYIIGYYGRVCINNGEYELMEKH